MDPILNCILAVCCPPQSEDQLKALTTFLIAGGVDPDAAESCARVVLDNFDLAPQGSLEAFKKAIAELARGDHYKG